MTRPTCRSRQQIPISGAKEVANPSKMVAWARVTLPFSAEFLFVKIIFNFG
jgi:hypothetical protein